MLQIISGKTCFLFQVVSSPAEAFEYLKVELEKLDTEDGDG